jgi:hypothetical protein
LVARLFELKEFFANFELSYETVQLRIPIAQLSSHTTCLSAAHLEEVEEAVSVVDAAVLLPVEVCSSGAAALQELQLTPRQDVVDLEELLRSVPLTRSMVCASALHPWPC